MKKIIKTALAVIITASFAVTPVKAEMSMILIPTENSFSETKHNLKKM